MVVDIFSGSNTTGFAAERAGRRWLSIESNRGYAELSSVRFMEGKALPEIQETLRHMKSGVPRLATDTLLTAAEA